MGEVLSARGLAFVCEFRVRLRRPGWRSRPGAECLLLFGGACFCRRFVVAACHRVRSRETILRALGAGCCGARRQSCSRCVAYGVLRRVNRRWDLPEAWLLAAASSECSLHRRCVCAPSASWLCLLRWASRLRMRAWMCSPVGVAACQWVWVRSAVWVLLSGALRLGSFRRDGVIWERRRGRRLRRYRPPRRASHRALDLWSPGEARVSSGRGAAAATTCAPSSWAPWEQTRVPAGA